MDSLMLSQLQILNEKLADFQNTVQTAINGGADVDIDAVKEFKDNIEGLISEFELETEDVPPEGGEEGEGGEE